MQQEEEIAELLISYKRDETTLADALNSIAALYEGDDVEESTGRRVVMRRAEAVHAISQIPIWEVMSMSVRALGDRVGCSKTLAWEIRREVALKKAEEERATRSAA